MNFELQKTKIFICTFPGNGYSQTRLLARASTFVRTPPLRREERARQVCHCRRVVSTLRRNNPYGRQLFADRNSTERRLRHAGCSPSLAVVD